MQKIIVKIKNEKDTRYLCGGPPPSYLMAYGLGLYPMDR